MTSDRSYRAAMPLGEAVAELRRGSGTQFDPRVVEALIQALRMPRERVVHGLAPAVGAVADG
jgi:HD-GYP domain-containing protein (c-di-GMP phosphodiesterase class II)